MTGVKVQLSRVEAEGKGRLPPICILCGALATDLRSQKFTFPGMGPLPAMFPFEAEVGCFLLALGLLLLFIVYVGAILIYMTAKEMTVHIPLCGRHARRWFLGFALRPESITDTEITLSGVSG